MIRFLLALAVMADHLAPVDWWGRWAVCVFYVFSGYGITATLQGKTPWQFWRRRFVRLYPQYFVVWILSNIWCGLYGNFQRMGFNVFPSLLMIDLRHGLSTIPQTWMFTNLLIFYALMSLGLGRDLKISATWMGLSLAGFIMQSFSVYGDEYFTVGFASLFFALGALWYWLPVWRLPKPGRILSVMSYPIFLSHYLIGAISSTLLQLPIGWPLFFVSLPPTIAFSWALVKLDSKLFWRNHA